MPSANVKHLKLSKKRGCNRKAMMVILNLLVRLIENQSFIFYNLIFSHLLPQPPPQTELLPLSTFPFGLIDLILASLWNNQPTMFDFPKLKLDGNLLVINWCFYPLLAIAIASTYCSLINTSQSLHSLDADGLFLTT